MKPALYIHGMLGMGDCIHQRAILRALMQTRDVTLLTYYAAMYHDLVADGLKITFPVRSAKPPRIKERGKVPIVHVPPGTAAKRLSYSPGEIKQAGSILAAMFQSVGLIMPARPDFSLPVPQAWRDAARALTATWPTGGKPLMIYRPIVLNKIWEAPARAPDPGAYAALYRSIRDRFFVVSVCNLPDDERIVGDEADADVKLHNGELDFEQLAGLFAEADLVFGNPGFTPVLAQAVGAPQIIVYGGNESFRTTNSVGAHLAPTLAIEPDRPCECHDRSHKGCDKRITLAPALAQIDEFVSSLAIKMRAPAAAKPTPAKPPRILIFGTTYVDTAERHALTQQWIDLHGKLNPDCDLLLVDSASPVRQLVEDRHGKLFATGGVVDANGKVELNFLEAPGGRLRVHQFADNIGHLSRGGRDGWGRAFCHGLAIAIAQKYDYVAHIEGDSLFRLPVRPIVERMRSGELGDVVSVPVGGTKRKEVGWVETGLMFFRVGYLAESDFIARYDWPNRQPKPTPEKIIFGLVERLTMMPWAAERGDKSQFTPQSARGLDWITHTRPEIFAAFLAANRMTAPAVALSAPQIKINLGCGTNRLPGWLNHDAEIDITKRLPFASGSADFIFAEHVVEHVDLYKAIDFFRECRRVLKVGGVLRIAAPSIEQIRNRGNQAYFDFARKWAPSADLRGAMSAILYAHGHKMAWTQSLLDTILFFVGFDQVTACRPGESAHDALVGVEGHGRVIGETFNAIETIVAEAS